MLPLQKISNKRNSSIKVCGEQIEKKLQKKYEN